MHVFLTLVMFNAEQDCVEFMKIWKCESEHAVMATELKVGLNMLEPKQLQIYCLFWLHSAGKKVN